MSKMDRFSKEPRPKGTGIRLRPSETNRGFFAV